MTSVDCRFSIPDAKYTPTVTDTAAHWMECVSHLDPRFGGLSAVVPQLGLNLVEQHGFRVDVAAFSAHDETDALASRRELQATHWPASRAAWLSDRELRRSFREAVTRVDGLHIHGIWETHAAIAAQTARSLDKPYIVSAHGMLEPWALQQKRLKKKIYASLLERENLNRAACLHALTRAEAQDYRMFGCTRPIAVIPNAVETPSAADTSIFLKSFPELRGRRLVLFLGRLHPKKGLELLIEAWAKVATQFPDATLVLAGPDEANYLAKLENLVSQRKLSASIVFAGMLDAQMKWSALASSHCFALPSYSEGFSVAVLEAMGMGLPVVISQQCHVPEVIEARAGWEILPEEQQLSAALSEMLGNSSLLNREIGDRARQLVRERYSWTVVAKQMAELYDWTVSRTTPKSFEFSEVDA